MTRVAKPISLGLCAALFLTWGALAAEESPPPSELPPPDAPPPRARNSHTTPPAPVVAPRNDQRDIDAPDFSDGPSVPGAAGAPSPEKKKSFDNSRTDINLYNKTAADPDRVKSLFYTATEVKDVHLAVNTYLKNIGRGGDLTFDEEAFLSRLGGLKKTSAANSGQARFFTYPQFFLDSLVYYSPSDWLVWLNGEKITPLTPRESSNIHIIGITPDKITVEWFPLEMSRVSEVWKKSPNDSITVDLRHGQVIFTLKPNQTFSSYVMRAVEGRVLPKTVDLTQMAQPYEFGKGEGEKPADAKPGELAPSDAPKEGLTGLINNFKEMNKEEK
jgi:hypothetical protein